MLKQLLHFFCALLCGRILYIDSKIIHLVTYPVWTKYYSTPVWAHQWSLKKETYSIHSDISWNRRKNGSNIHLLNLSISITINYVPFFSFIYLFIFLNYVLIPTEFLLILQQLNCSALFWCECSKEKGRHKNDRMIPDFSSWHYRSPLRCYCICQSQELLLSVVRQAAKIHLKCLTFIQRMLLIYLISCVLKFSQSYSSVC